MEHQTESRATEVGLKIHLVPPDAITADPSFQVRARIDGGKVHEYATAMRVGAAFPPLRLARINGALFLIDGWHRLEAHKRRLSMVKEWSDRRKLEAIAVTIEDMSEADARFAAATANLRHGLPMKPRERKRVFKLYMEQGRWRARAGQVKPTRKIAEDLGGLAAHTTIWMWIKREHPRVAALMENPEGSRRAGVEPPTPHAIPSLFPKDARGHLEAARKAVRGVSDPEERRAILEEVRQLAAELRGEWTGPEAEPEAF